MASAAESWLRYRFPSRAYRKGNASLRPKNRPRTPRKAEPSEEAHGLDGHAGLHRSTHECCLRRAGRWRETRLTNHHATVNFHAISCGHREIAAQLAGVTPDGSANRFPRLVRKAETDLEDSIPST